jgi:hypothetical protein
MFEYPVRLNLSVIWLLLRQFSACVTHLKFSILLSNLFLLIWSILGLLSGLGIKASANNLCILVVVPILSLYKSKMYL